STVILLSALFYSMLPLLPRSTLFPYTTLFRSQLAIRALLRLVMRIGGVRLKCRDRRMRRHQTGARERVHHVPLQRRLPHFLTARSEEHTSELQSRFDLVCRLLLEKKNTNSVLQ